MPRIKGTMLDSETLALGPRALIWELAVLPFELEITEGDVRVARGDKAFNILVDYTEMSTRGFDIDMNTISWTSDVRGSDLEWECWRKMHFEPRTRTGHETLPASNILKPSELFGLLGSVVGAGAVWFRNAAFDVPAIENLAGIAGLGMPWHRRQQSDIYTQIDMARQMHGYQERNRTMTSHRALEDASAQLEELAEVCKVLYAGRGTEPTPEEGIEI